MMDHTQYRKGVMADPHSQDPELRMHRDGCAECRAYTQKLLEFEARLQRAMRVEIPVHAQVSPPRRWLALAASVLVGVAVAGGIWLSLPQRSLAAAVVAHMAGEPDAWRRTDVPVDAPALQDVLKDSKLRLKPDAGIVSYASSCQFRGHVVPHLVVQSASGPVAVMVLVHEPMRKSMDFDEQGYRGTIVPVPGHGSIAVLMRDSGVSREAVEQIAARVDASIVWER
jgi:Protein of unknown function (DUF3379)